MSVAGFLCAVILAAGCGGGSTAAGSASPLDRFDSARAFNLLKEQVAVGPRPAGSPQLRRLATRLRSMLPRGRFEPVGGGLRNIVGTIPGRGPAILVGAHYDTQPLPKGFVGANDSAAGTAAVIEIARALRTALPANHREIRFVLFDGEEQPRGCHDFLACALRGSKAYAAAHPGEIGQLVLLDYIANKGLRIPRETNSDSALWSRLRSAAREAGDSAFFPVTTQVPIIDDHIPFIQAGVQSIDLIDWAYPYKNTVKDTTDKLSPKALDAVGETVAQLAISLSH